MPSSKDYLNYILEQLSPLEVTFKPMMGEFLIYYRGKLAGGIYDNRLLIKPVKSAISYISEPVYALPYEGAKEMLLVENVDDGNYLIGLFEAIYGDLPISKAKR